MSSVALPVNCHLPFGPAILSTNDASWPTLNFSVHLSRMDISCSSLLRARGASLPLSPRQFFSRITQFFGRPFISDGCRGRSVPQKASDEALCFRVWHSRPFPGNIKSTCCAVSRRSVLVSVFYESKFRPACSAKTSSLFLFLRQVSRPTHGK